MRKIFLSVIGFSFLCRVGVYAQTKPDSAAYKPAYSQSPAPKKDSTQFNPRKLRLDEVNFVTSYYSQNGNHSAVTGGIGTEKVTDFANGITLNFVNTDNNNHKNTLTAGLGFDLHTSASQAYVSKTGASRPSGTRVYPSLDWTVENTKTGNTFGVGAYYSNEYNYKSIGADVHYSVKTDNKAGEFSAKLQGYFDNVTLIYPSELAPISTVIPVTGRHGDGEGHRDNFGTSPRKTYSAAFEYSQIINSRLQIAFLADVVGQNGFLSLPFHRVYFSNGNEAIEKLPSTRFKLPLGFRANYFVGDNIILRSYYRYYADSWGTRSNTANLEVAYKISPFFSISPFYRYYTQTAARYFAPYEMQSQASPYYTSNYEYAAFKSQFYGVGFRVAPPGGVFGVKGLHDLEVRYGHYTQTTDLVSDVVSLSLGFK
ncbi:DUF3570 domain-containing protein [uncultured Mucilaginibacter sp.]|uniref:DUF3570 domain-containing protein n=1 Tax=uncultured Mucilaginibacter sp. TaxID=797541 RepID=UPI0025DDFDDC|nr:DUF3570 domain-containing protein [uncultured Mucilaginibacter sp.]